MLNFIRTARSQNERLVNSSIIAAIGLMLFATVAQTKMFFAGHADYLVSPMFFATAMVLLWILRSKRLALNTKAQAFALALGLVCIVIAPASPNALTVGTMLLVLATSVWMFTQPSIAVLAFWFLAASGALTSHTLLAASPETVSGKSFMLILVGGAISLLVYYHAKALVNQRELLENALFTSKLGVVKRFIQDSDELHLDQLAQQILRHDNERMRFFDFIQKLASRADRDKLLVLCSPEKSCQEDECGFTLEYGDGRYLSITIFSDYEDQIWLLEDVTERQQVEKKQQAHLKTQQTLLAQLQRQQQVNELAISAANLVIYELDAATGFARVVAGQSSWPELWRTKPFINVLGDVMPKEDWRALESAIENPGELAEVLIRHPQTGEAVYWGQFGFTPVREVDGRKIQMGYRLITDSLVSARGEAQEARLEAERMLARLNDVASGGRVGLFRHNLIDDSWECNDIYREFYGLPVQDFPEVTTELIDSRFDPHTRDEQIQERLNARGGNTQGSHERHLLLPDGTRRELLTYAKAEYDGDKIIAMVGSAFDVTNERQTARELTQSNTRLSELLDRQRSMFAVIGHELRTPVASIEMLANDTDLSDREKIDLVGGISQGLLGVLEDLRTVIAPDRIKESQIVVDYPSVVIKRALGPLSSLLQERSVQLHLDLPPDEMQCRFNAQALRQLVTNLVKNAAIHAEGRNTYVTLTKISSSEQNICAQLRVEDDGKGIPTDQVNSLFGAYARGDTESEGSGLGLFICSELAMALGGQIHYEASTRGGAAFVVNMNVVVGEQSHGASELNTAHYDFSRKRILVAEDDRTLQLLTAKMLTKAGAKVRVCGDGREALDAYQEDQFDLVVTDIMMPGLNGYAFAKALRAAGYEGPIIGATAAVVGSETDDLIAAGADAAISKPISLAKLKAELARLEMSVGAM